MKHQKLLPGLHRFEDTCNVYVIENGRSSIAIDFGSGRWLEEFRKLNLPPLCKVFITHSHADQCEGLLANENWQFEIHAPAAEKPLLDPAGVKEFWRTRRKMGTPVSYSVLQRGLKQVKFDMVGWWDCFWETSRIRFIDTPGHGPGAVSIVADVGDRQVIFCGDAAHAEAKIWQPYNLEWDHWTGSGALAAWQGVERLRAVGADMLCPSHGPVIAERIQQTLRVLSGRLLELYNVKGSICAGEKDYYLTPRMLKCGAREVLPELIQFGVNSYLLMSAHNEGLVIDPHSHDIDQLEPLLVELGNPKVTAATGSHFHLDHTNGLPILKEKHGTTIFLHPHVAAPIRDLDKFDVPWLPEAPILADKLLPVSGNWKWNEYKIRCAPFPGQTYWHCLLMTEVSGRKVAFVGDNFQPPSRWNGTGGFSSFNGSTFDGFIRSAERVIEWKPDIAAAGHSTYILYNERYYRKVIKWADKARAAVEALCPSGKLEVDYYRHKEQKKQAAKGAN